MLASVPLVHTLEHPVRLVYGIDGALGENLKVGVGHHCGDFNDDVVIRVEPCHFQVDPDQVTFVIHKRYFPTE